MIILGYFLAFKIIRQLNLQSENQTANKSDRNYHKYTWSWPYIFLYNKVFLRSYLEIMFNNAHKVTLIFSLNTHYTLYDYQIN